MELCQAPEPCLCDSALCHVPTDRAGMGTVQTPMHRNLATHLLVLDRTWHSTISPNTSKRFFSSLELMLLERFLMYTTRPSPCQHQATGLRLPTHTSTAADGYWKHGVPGAPTLTMQCCWLPAHQLTPLTLIKCLLHPSGVCSSSL